MAGRTSRAFGRYWWLVLAITVVFGGAGFGLSLLWRWLWPTWRADARIMISGSRPMNPLDPEASQSPAELKEFIASQALLVKERAVIRRALQEPILRETTWFKRNYQQDMKNLENGLQADIHVRVIPDTLLIEVSFESDQRRDVAPVVNSVVKVYLEWIRDLIKQETRSHLNTLRNEETKLKSAMRLRMTEVKVLSRGVGGLRTGGPPLDTGAVVRDLRQALARAEVDLELAKAEFEDTKRMSLGVLAETEPEASVPAPTTRKSPSAETQATLASLLRAVLSARRKVKVLTGKLEIGMVEQRDLDQKIGEFRMAEQEYRNVQELYKLISGQRRKLEVVLSAPDNLSIDRAGQALPPIEPYAPNPAVNTILGALLGLVCSVAVVLIIAAASKPESVPLTPLPA